MLDTKGCKQALIIRNFYCISTATVVARTRQNVKVTRTLPVLRTSPVVTQRAPAGLFLQKDRRSACRAVIFYDVNDKTRKSVKG